MSTPPGYDTAPVREDSAYSGTSQPGLDPTLEPGNSPASLFGVALPQGTGAAGSPGAVTAGTDPTNEPGQTSEGLSGLGPAEIADTGAPGSAGVTEAPGGTDTVMFTRPGSYLSGTNEQDTVQDFVSGVNDWTQAADGSYGSGPQLPGIAGNMPQGTGAGQGSVHKGEGGFR